MILCGIDEAGRGALAGPVVAAAVVLNENELIKDSKDSKLVKESIRERLYDEIFASAIEVKTGIIWNDDIDSINILKATMRAIQYSIHTLQVKPNKYLVDGNYFRFEDGSHVNLNYDAVVKGDSKIHCISCASIIAKVTRDRIMRNLHEEYPEYGFHLHKGYATAKHIEVISKHGVTKYHRKTFCKKFNQLNLTFQK